MRKQQLKTGLFLFGLLLSASITLANEPNIKFTNAELNLLKSFGPWPPKFSKDDSNRFSKNPDAIRFGKELFFAKALSGPSNISCADCHDPDRAFADQVNRSVGQEMVDRNSIALANLSLNRWFGWDGRSDNLWAQSIHPLLDSREMAATSDDVASFLTADANYAQKYQQLVGVDASADPSETVLVNVAKFLASYQETIQTPVTKFDIFLENLTNEQDTSDYPESAKRGLKIFISDANCFVCHFGPNFTNNEFSNNALPHFIDGGNVDAKVDGGRFIGIQNFKSDPYRKDGTHSDADSKNQLTSFVKLQPQNWGEFRVPTLRNVANTAPYMHDGSLQTLDSVMRHYSTINEERLHTEGENILKPLNLTEQEIDDLISFLNTLSGNPNHFE